MASIYLHIPFCRRICGYCDFFKSARTELMPQVLSAMMNELEEQRESLSTRNLSTIYFGGGTPSLLKINNIYSLLAQINRLYNTSTVSEITFEANPDDLTEDYLYGLRDVGINRLSIGVQSFDDRELKFMNRRHNVDKAKRAIEMARKAGFDNIAIDLIFGVEGFGEDILKHSIAEAISLDVEHIAAYHLTIEDGTLFSRRVKRGEFGVVPEEVSESEYLTIHKALTQAGYEHYEISNYARHGRRSQHNSAYWDGSEYLGIGAGAHSYFNGKRRWAHNSLEQYIEGGKQRYEEESITEIQHRNETIMTSLRRCEGIDLALFLDRFGELAYNKLKNDSKLLVLSGDLIIDKARMYIPAEHFLRSDMIIEQLFVV